MRATAIISTSAQPTCTQARGQQGFPTHQRRRIALCDHVGIGVLLPMALKRMLPLSTLSISFYCPHLRLRCVSIPIVTFGHLWPPFR
ncbi:hypothetical protein BU26DRAFT_514247 [Trematosphaeria pertusa]|uniref:Uncharacterized protein n=1 Tax=Trematosphaeria pertusa TaxID=390896 RepID=A0A6A6IWI9_9PLEO|nr:uncharacterized protein BU26DRAFT_514247 [Trematosphaeria pertusa]KAF2254302.1 hypothetical protein BU26DRAFT_514247 [Trematosphaeria pertusa]